MHEKGDQGGESRVEGAPPGVSVIVPTFREEPNLAPLVAAIAATREAHGLDLDVWIMDDQSGDGSRERVAALNTDWVRFIERDGERGLSPAVVEGIERSHGESIVVMDADLSHPAAAIPDMLAALAGGADFAVGSRYVPGGSTDDEWGPFRWVNSRVATLLARPLVRLSDPMSGFFALRRDRLGDVPLNPVGYKIGLEIIVKCRMRRIAEIPIHFADRSAGESKLTFKQQALYLEHLRRLYAFRFTGKAREGRR